MPDPRMPMREHQTLCNEPRFPDASSLRAASVLALLIDQHGDRTDEQNFGSWGRSTCDYAFQGTREYPWAWRAGSITQTAWALLALRAISAELTTGPIVTAIRKAQERAAFYVGYSLRRKYDEEPALKSTRHLLTTSIAYELLPDDLKDQQKKTATDAIAPLFGQALSILEGWASDASPLVVDMAQVCLYSQFFAQLLREHQNVKDNPAYGLAYRDIVGRLDDVSKRCLRRGVALTAEGDSRVLNPMLQTTMFLDMMRLQSNGTGISGEQEPIERVAIRLCKQWIAWIMDVPIRRHPALSPMGVIDTWTILSFCSIAAEYKTWFSEKEVAALELAYGKAFTHVQGPHQCLFATTVHWSILARRIAQDIDFLAQPCLADWDDSRETLNGVLGPTLQKRAGREVITFLTHVSRHKFGLQVHGNHKVSPSSPSRAILSEYFRITSSNYVLDEATFLRHRSLTWGESGLRLHPDVPRVHILLAGYSTSGKSTVATLLTSVTANVVILRRATTRSIREEHPEAFLYDCVGTVTFKRLKKAGDIVAPHELWGEQYAFLNSSLVDACTGSVVIWQVGWSPQAIRAIRAHLMTALPNEPSELVVLRPEIGELEDRLSRERFRPKHAIPGDLAEACAFYDSVLQDAPDARLVDTSSSPEGAAYTVLCYLEKYLVPATNRSSTWDVFVSYARPNGELLVWPLVRKVRSRGLAVWVDVGALRPGQNFVTMIGTGIISSNVVAAIVTPQYLKSKWASHELSVAIKYHIDRRLTLIPILVGVTPEEFSNEFPAASIVSCHVTSSRQIGDITVVREITETLIEAVRRLSRESTL